MTDQEQIYELSKITGIDTHRLEAKLEMLRSSYTEIKLFYLSTGRFPSKYEDMVLYEHGDSYLKWLKNPILTSK